MDQLNHLKNQKEIEKEVEEKIRGDKNEKIKKENNKEIKEEQKDDNNSQFMDEEGNIYNFDELTEEEKMSILQQQLILQKLQEEAEARGEKFDPQEYFEFLEQQAEEEELMQKKDSNKLNKSF